MSVSLIQVPYHLGQEDVELPDWREAPAPEEP